MAREEEQLGCCVSLARVDMRIFTQAALNQAIHEHVQSEWNEQLFCAHHNMHSLALASSERDFFAYHKRAQLHWIDGMPLIFMLRFLGYELDRNWRVTFLDWQHSFFSMCSENGFKVFLLGSQPASIERAANNIQAMHPKLRVNFHHGYLSEANGSNSYAINFINGFDPDILIVGMGMPQQECWILNNGAKTNAKVLMPVGGFFDYLAGDTYTPPRWTGKLGLEWLARLLSAPRRLGYRYLIEPWPVIIRFIRELRERTNSPN